MDDEMKALEDNKTWELVRMPKEKKTVGCKWMYTVKYRADGSIERYKARLVAKGYAQTYGIDYQETFDPVAKMNGKNFVVIGSKLWLGFRPIRCEKCIFAWKLGKINIYGYPTWIQQKYTRSYSVYANKALYGLKQSPRVWFGRFSKVMISMGYKKKSRRPRIVH